MSVLGELSTARGHPRPSQLAHEAIEKSWPTALGETIARLAQAASVVHQGPGPVLAEAERPARAALVVHGTVVATWGAPDGRTVFAGLYGPGQFMGLATLTGEPMTVGIDALTDVTILAWHSAEFRHIATTDPAMAVDLLDRSVYAIRALNYMIKVRTFASARSRLAALLMKYEPICFSTSSPLVPRGQLAGLAGVTPRMVRAILGKWVASGIIRRVGVSGLELVDRPALTAHAAPLDDFPAPDPSAHGAWTAPRVDR
jgi:CRP-like cAMP-binding protein